jgi:ubiquinone biosynthesis protein Coq4
MRFHQPDVDEMMEMGFFAKVWLALKAMHALTKNIIDPWGQKAFQWALDSWGVRRIAEQAHHDENGRTLLRDRPMLDLNLTELERLPEGSLGHFLANWFRAWKLEPFEHRRVAKSETEYFMDRLFFTHDVWHALVGLGTDLQNEVRFLAVLLAQYASGSAVVALFVGWLRMPMNGRIAGFFAFPYEAWRLYRWGCNCRNLCFVPWETLLASPVEEVRARFLDPRRPRIGEWQYWPTAHVALPPKLGNHHHEPPMTATSL